MKLASQEVRKWKTMFEKYAGTGLDKDACMALMDDWLEMASALSHMKVTLSGGGQSADAEPPSDHWRIVEYAFAFQTAEANALLEKGWEPYGFPFAGYSSPIQAMVLREGSGLAKSISFPLVYHRARGQWDVYFGPGQSDRSFNTEAEAQAYIDGQKK